jgi:CXXX repeat modification system protein
VLSHLIVPLDAAATSFCYYENERYALGSSDLLPLKTLVGFLDWIRPQRLAVNFIYGHTPPPDDYADLIESVAHIKIVPLCLQGVDRKAMVVINPQDVGRFSELDASDDRNVVLRLSKERITELADIITSLIGKCRRVNVILLGIRHYTDADFPVYRAQLRKLLPLLVEEFRSGRSFELSNLTDRIFLKQMRNCEAGLAHLTMAPGGKLDLCPAFAHADAGDSVEAMSGNIAIPNAHLLALDHSPICSLCDAFHCKRCLWLNKRLTGEINTPSRQQCVLSHLEREASYELVECLRGLEGLRHIPRIQSLDYLDPFELIERAGGYPTPQAPAGHPSKEKSEGEAHIAQTKAHSQDQSSVFSSGVDPGIRKRVGQVSPKERDQIQRLFECRNGLGEMARALAGLGQAELTDNALYGRIRTEMGEVSTQFDAWWQQKAAEYGWESAPDAKWQIDFSTCAIYLVRSA